MLDATTQAEILRLYYAEKLSYRAIALKLGVHRQSVRDVVYRRSIKLERNQTDRGSILDPFHAKIEELLKAEPSRSAVNILQELRPKGYKGGITIIRDHLRVERPRPEPKAYLSLEFVPGQAAQVDWGDFGDPFGLGRKLWCFVMVLCWSRLLYLEFTLSACFESFIRCHEHAFAFFEGVPLELWYDNLATAVAERMGKIVRFNPQFIAYAADRGFRPVACNLQAGHEKGRVEDGVRYVRHNFWPGRSFEDHKDVNLQGIDWRNTFANKRLHAVTRKIPELIFPQEKPHLIPLPPPYDTDEKKSHRVSHQFFIAFDANEYSVPWRLSERILTIRGDEDTVRVFLGDNRVAVHERSWGKNKRVENPAHKAFA
jgi:transposase